MKWLRAPWWSWLLLLLGLIVFCGLGIWQIHRAQSKWSLMAQRQMASELSPVALRSVERPQQAYGERVSVTGTYLESRQILMDNQIYQGHVGYHAWTPLKLPDGRLVLVDRGWVSMGVDRAHPPKPSVPEGRQTVSGIWRDWPQAGVALHADGICAQDDWPRVLHYPQYQHIDCQYSAVVIDGLLLLSEAEPGGFPRNWHNVGLSPMRHIGYAVQWFAMALAAAVIFVVLNGRRKRTTNSLD